MNQTATVKDLIPLKKGRWIQFSTDISQPYRKKASLLCGAATIRLHPALFIWEEYAQGLKVIRVR